MIIKKQNKSNFIIKIINSKDFLENDKEKLLNNNMKTFKIKECINKKSLAIVNNKKIKIL